MTRTALDEEAMEVELPRRLAIPAPAHIALSLLAGFVAGAMFAMVIVS